MHINLDDETSYSYEMDLDKHKKKIIKHIFIDIKKIIELYDDYTIDIMIKLFIFYKKESNLKLKKNIEPYIELIIKLSNLDYVDQEEYFIIIFKLLQIFKIKDNVEKYIIKNINIKSSTLTSEENKKNFINITYFNNKIIILIDEIVKYNKIVEKILKINNDILDNERNIKYITVISEILCKELYINYSSIDAYSLINNLIKNAYKEIFIKKYDDTKKKIKYIYEDKINTNMILKYKINLDKKNINIMIDNFNKINNLLN